MFFQTKTGANYFEEKTTKKIVRLMNEQEGHRLLTPLPNNRGLFLKNNSRLIVFSLLSSIEFSTLAEIPVDTKRVICVANKKFCVLTHKQYDIEATDIFLWNSSTLESLFRCYTTRISVSALALQNDRLFIGTRGGDLYLHIAKLHGKEEDLDYGRQAFHNEDGHSATHKERLLALRECFEEKCTPESYDSSSSIHSSSRPYRSTRKLSYNL